MADNETPLVKKVTAPVVFTFKLVKVFELMSWLKVIALFVIKLWLEEPAAVCVTPLKSLERTESVAVAVPPKLIIPRIRPEQAAV